MILKLLETLSVSNIDKEYQRNYKNLISEEDFWTLVTLDPTSYGKNVIPYSDGVDPEKVGQFVSIGKNASKGQYGGLFVRCWLNGEKDFINNPRLKQACLKYIQNRGQFEIRDLSQFPSVKSFIEYVLDGKTPEITLDKVVVKKDGPKEKLENLRQKQFPDIKDVEELITIAELDPESDVEHGQVGTVAKTLLLPLANKGFTKFLNKQVSLKHAILNYYKKLTSDKEFVNNNSLKSFVDRSIQDNVDYSLSFISKYINNTSKDTVFVDTLKSLLTENRDFRIVTISRNYDVIHLLSTEAAILADHCNVSKETILGEAGMDMTADSYDKKRAILQYGNKHDASDSNNAVNKWCTGWARSMFDSYGRNPYRLYCFIYRPDPSAATKNWQIALSDVGYLRDLEDGRNPHSEGAQAHIIPFLTVLEKNLDIVPDLMNEPNFMNWTEFSDFVNSLSNKVDLKKYTFDEDDPSIEKVLPPLVWSKSADLDNYLQEHSCSKLDIEKLIIAEGVKEIPDYEFEGLKGLIEVIMGSTVEQIGVRAFYNCLSLYKVKLSSNLKVIKYGAFENCRSLKGAIRLPITIEKIETWAFKNHDNTSGLWFILSKKILEIPNKKLLLPSWPESEKLWWGKKNRFVISDN